MARNWVSFNEYEDVLASTDLLALIVPQLKPRPTNWKWVILAAHNGLQGALVCAIQDTSGTNILAKKSEKETLQWLDDGQGGEPTQFLADFKTLIDKYQSKYPNSQITTGQLENVRKLHDEFRNNFAHFTPKSWLIEIAMLPSIVTDALDLIEMAMREPQVWMHLSGNMKRRLANNLEFARIGLKTSGKKAI